MSILSKLQSRDIFRHVILVFNMQAFGKRLSKLLLKPFFIFGLMEV